jgi:hypothetical protein
LSTSGLMPGLSSKATSFSSFGMYTSWIYKSHPEFRLVSGLWTSNAQFPLRLFSDYVTSGLVVETAHGEEVTCHSQRCERELRLLSTFRKEFVMRRTNHLGGRDQNVRAVHVVL